MIWAALIIAVAILLVAYPKRTLWTLAALVLVGVLAVGSVVGFIAFDNWRSRRAEDYKRRMVEIEVSYDPNSCHPDRPLILKVHNKSKETIAYVSCKFRAKPPERSSYVSLSGDDHFKTDQYIRPKSSVQFCCPLPPMWEKGFDPARLLWSVDERWVRFEDPKVAGESEARVRSAEAEKVRLAKALTALSDAQIKQLAMGDAKTSEGKAFKAGDKIIMGIPLRWIPPGQFMMGSPSSEEGRDFDEDQCKVILTRGFFLGETECTQDQWEAVMGSNPSRFKGAHRPVERLSWTDAVEYCKRLTAKQQAEGILPKGWEWRLPTEAEWEYAARAATVGSRYGELDAIAWYGGNSGGETHPVMQKAANAWGLHDMMGNVWEWCSGWAGEYPTGSVTDPVGPDSASHRVCRGGSWDGSASNVRSAVRGKFFPESSYQNLGFRPALTMIR